MKYVALLRGINVGGNSKVEMKQLKTTVENLGLESVKTYINSGNILFSDSKHTPAQLVTLLEQAIEKQCGFSVRVLLRDQNALAKIYHALPETWQNNTEMKCDVLFLWDTVDAPNILDTLQIREGIDEVRYLPGAILWRVDRKDIGKSGLLKIVGTPFYKQVTIRNCNTTRKLHALMTSL